MAKKKTAKKAAKKKTAKKTTAKKATKKSTKKKAPSVARKTVSKRRPKRGLAIVGLILNLLILPGLGSIIGGRTTEGIWQIVLMVVGFFLTFAIVGFPIMGIAWIWGLITGVRMVQEAS